MKKLIACMALSGIMAISAYANVIKVEIHTSCGPIGHLEVDTEKGWTVDEILQFADDFETAVCGE